MRKSSVIKIYPVRHHFANVTSAYHFMGYSMATLIAVDGASEAEATVI